MHPGIYVGLGANLGDRQARIEEALRKLDDREKTRVVAVSALYETQPVGVVDQPLFLNAAASVTTALSPSELLEVLLRIESELGRVRERKWGPRNIDLDLLLYGQMVIGQEGIVVPHPLLHERDFALTPLCDLDPEFVHPVLRRTLSDLRRALPREVPLRAVGNLAWNRPG